MATPLETVDKKWEGYPYECVIPYSNSPPLPNWIALEEGDQGKIAKVSDATRDVVAGKYVFVKVPRRGEIQGWVPAWSIRVGSHPYGSNRFEHDVQAEKPTLGQFLTKDYNPKFAVERAIYALLRAFYDERDRLGFAGKFNKKLDTPAACIATTKRLCEGIAEAAPHKNLWKALNRPNFSLEDIVLLCSGPEQKPNKPMPVHDILDQRKGVYLIWYWGFTGKDRIGDVACYAGKTNAGFANRMNSHRSASNSSDSSQALGRHYTIRRAAPRIKAHLLAELEDTDDQQLMEQVAVLLFDTTHSTLLKRSFEEPSNQPLQDPSKAYVHATGAQEFARIAEAAAEQSGWYGVQRPSFHHSGHVYGCNATVPLLEAGSHERNLYIKQVGPNGFVEFHAPPANLTEMESRNRLHIRTITGFPSKEKLSFSILQDPNRPSLRPNKTVYTTFEIAPVGIVHSKRWARLPLIGPWPDWDTTHRLAVRIDWQDDDGKWERMYLQRVHVMYIGNERGSWGSYATAIGLFQFLHQIPVQKGTQLWRKDYGLARVKEATYSHMAQKWTILGCKPVIDPATQVQKHLLSADEMITQYNKMKVPSTAVNPRQPFFLYGTGGQARVRCDICCRAPNIVKHTGHVWPEERSLDETMQSHCTYTPSNPDRCTECYHRGLLCTFTPLAELPTATRFLDGILGAPKADNCIYEIDDPEIHTGVAA